MSRRRIRGRSLWSAWPMAPCALALPRPTRGDRNRLGTKGGVARRQFERRSCHLVAFDGTAMKVWCCAQATVAYCLECFPAGEIKGNSPEGVVAG